MQEFDDFQAGDDITDTKAYRLAFFDILCLSFSSVKHCSYCPQYQMTLFSFCLLFFVLIKICDTSDKKYVDLEYGHVLAT
jgi:hypothetical protein